MRRQTRILILLLVFTMFMAISASMTRVWLDELSPKGEPMFAVRKHLSLKTPRIKEANRNLIRLHSPEPGSLVSSPIVLSGEARGYWFFEADAPVFLYDAEGGEIANSFISADGEWTTEDFVSFEGRLEFGAPETDAGTLVFRNANASGDVERDIQLRIPVRFE